MASLAAVSVSVPSYAALKAAGSKKVTVSRSAAVVCSAAPVESNWSKAAKVLVATGAGVLLAASSASAAVTVKLGADSGALVFEPQELTIPAGETIKFVNNAGFPHNIVFDEEDIPAGVNADAISQSEYLNGPGETYSLTLNEKGVYNGYCEPHQGGGMKVKITVE